MKVDNVKKEMMLNTDIDKMVVHGYTVSQFLFYWLSSYQGNNPIPIIDETGFIKVINFNIDVDPNGDVKEIGEKLKDFGFTIELVERKIDMIVIRDKR